MSNGKQNSLKNRIKRFFDVNYLLNNQKYSKKNTAFVFNFKN